MRTDWLENACFTLLISKETGLGRDPWVGCVDELMDETSHSQKLQDMIFYLWSLSQYQKLSAELLSGGRQLLGDKNKLLWVMPWWCSFFGGSQNEKSSLDLLLVLWVKTREATNHSVSHWQQYRRWDGPQDMLQVANEHLGSPKMMWTMYLGKQDTTFGPNYPVAMAI